MPPLPSRHAVPPGFTLVETITVVAILAILATLALPALGDMVKNGRRTNTVNELGASLMLARGEALKRGLPVVVCGVDDANGNHALDAAERACSGLDWGDGWMVAYWSDADSDAVLDGGELQAPVSVYLNEQATIRITASGMALEPATGAFALQPFNRTGTSGRITICDARGASRARGIEVASTGRTRLLVSATEDAVNGTTLTCP